jgi:hypothetical protein
MVSYHTILFWIEWYDMILRHGPQGVSFVVCQSMPSDKDAARRNGERGTARLSLCQAGGDMLVEDGRIIVACGKGCRVRQDDPMWR